MQLPSCSQHKQGTSGWLDDRKKTPLTGSVIPDICHVGYNSMHRRWEIVTGRHKPEPSAFLQQLFDYGHETEPRALEALKMFFTVRGHSFTLDETSLWNNPKYPHFSATPDAIMNFDDKKWAVELKCPQNLDSVRVGEKKWMCYIIQLAVEIMCTEAAGGILFVYAPPETGQSCLVTVWIRDIELEYLILEYVTKFMYYLRNDIEPPQRVSKAEKQPLLDYFSKKLLENPSLMA